MTYSRATAALAPVLLTTPAEATGSRVYPSPDRTMVAATVPTGPGKEHRIEIRNRRGKVLISADHSSTDGEHALVADQAASMHSATAGSRRQS